MYRTIRRIFFGLVIFGTTTIVLPQDTQGPVIVEMGDGAVDGGNIKPYEFTWRQCSKSGEEWVDGGTLTERVTRHVEDEQSLLRHEQETQRPDGGRSVAVTWFDAKTLSPLKVEVSMLDEAGTELAGARYRLNGDGYSGYKFQGEERVEVSGKLTSRMYHGMALGLPLAALNRNGDRPVELSASMLSFDASYRVIATDAGTEKIRIGDRDVTGTIVDVEWHHLESGDVYGPGPDASGGRYWILTDPPPDAPYVPRYKTDSYVVEFIPGYCPAAG